MVNKITSPITPLGEIDKINEIIDELGNIDPLPSQTGQSGKYLTTNGTVPSWAEVQSLPSQTGKAGKFLQTDGTDASWESAPFRNIGEIVASTIPLTDAGLHLLDGALIDGNGAYSDFVDYIANIYKTKDRVYNPDAFTVVGSPTITDDGIASGFSSNSYLQASINLSNKPFIFETPKFVYSQVASSDRQYLFTYGSYNTNLFMQAFITRTGALNTSIRNNNTDILYKSYQLILNNSYQIKYVLNNTEVSIYLKTNDNDYELWYTTTNTSLYTVNNTNMCIGQEYNSSTRFYLGSIDLKQFSITVDGKEVFSGSKPANYFCTEAQWQQSVTDYGVCGKFVYDSTNNTVRLPKITGILEGTTDVNALGDLVQAGLPNIQGSAYLHAVEQANIFNDVTGVLRGAGGSSDSFRSPSSLGINSGVKSSGGITLDASRSSSIYGNSSTVQPQTIKCYYYIVIATSTKTDIEVDIDNIATDLNGKADTDLTNVTDTAKVLMSGMGMPSDRYINLTLGASGTTYTAPANGYFSILARSAITVRFDGLRYNVTMPDVSDSLSGVIFPILKGKTIALSYGTLDLSDSWNYFRFIYAKGSESEV